MAASAVLRLLATVAAAVAVAAGGGDGCECGCAGCGCGAAMVLAVNAVDVMSASAPAATPDRGGDCANGVFDVDAHGGQGGSDGNDWGGDGTAHGGDAG